MNNYGFLFYEAPLLQDSVDLHDGHQPLKPQNLAQNEMGPLDNMHNLQFIGAIDFGLVLTSGETKDIYKITPSFFVEFENESNTIQAAHSVGCCLRNNNIECLQDTQRSKRLNLSKRNELDDFHVYGAQWKDLHINQSLVGVTFGKSE